MDELKEYSDIANNILKNSDNYTRSKKIISDIFESKKDDCNAVIFRLTVIDSYYSTQMNKRLFGLDDLAKKIIEVGSNDELLKQKCELFLKDPENSNGIQELFKCDEYGIQKTGEFFGQASSLISKYLYFLMGSEFPIYDNLAKISYEKIRTTPKYKSLELLKLEKDFNISYFKNLTKLKKVSKIESYNKLDNLLWLIGKITQGSLHLVIGRTLYEELSKKTELISESKKIKEENKKIKTENDKEKTKVKRIKFNADMIIRDYIRNNLNEVFKDNKDLIKLFDFSFKLS